ncbi:mucin-2-like isoform X2 [Nerophis ophidion]|uniref:mucin-2-like isoform X2 n=1 Tax=Nerophis ophidion TaxID=159077 RepID=UPI002AE0808F|nr:mucin-2-like isoform X2 [Nerophis ophidion]
MALVPGQGEGERRRARGVSAGVRMALVPGQGERRRARGVSAGVRMALHLPLAMALLMGLVDSLCASGTEQKQTEPTPVQNLPSSSRYFTSSGPTRPGFTGPTGPGSTNLTRPGLTGPTGPGSTNLTRPGLTGPTGPGSTNLTRPGLTGLTGPGSTNLTRPGLTGPTRPSLTGPAGPGFTNLTRPGLTGPTGPGSTNLTRPGLTGPTRPSLTGPAGPGFTNLTRPGLKGPMGPGFTNLTRPPSIEDQLNQIHKDLENQTQNFVSEDKEKFQDYEDHLASSSSSSSSGVCREEDLVAASQALCASTFYQQMEHLSPDQHCLLLDRVIMAYNDMTLCLEELSHWAGCFYPNSQVQDLFLQVHSSFFQQCPRQERPLEDAPHGLAVALTLGTVSILPVLVYLVGWRSGVDPAR